MRIFLSAVFAVLTNLTNARSIWALPDIVFITRPQNNLPSLDLTTTCFRNSVAAPITHVPRGGDLYIRFGADGFLKNITAAADYGTQTKIAVRDPNVHWDGNKIIFSMIVDTATSFGKWQLFEATNLGRNSIPVLKKVAGQAENYNNFMPVYTSDDRIVFVSDRPKACLLNTYPLRDEYGGDPINTGLWMLNPSDGTLENLEHSPSGSFLPTIDSFGRLLFSRWDHLQKEPTQVFNSNGFTRVKFSSESSSEFSVTPDGELPPFSSLPHFSLINPWQMNQDGTEMETINHIGRQELQYGGLTTSNFESAIESHGDLNVTNSIPSIAQVANQNRVYEGVMNIVEDPTKPGRYLAVSPVHSVTACSGMLFSFEAPPGKLAGDITVQYVTHPSSVVVPGAEFYNSPAPTSYDPGYFRDPLPLSTGELLAVNQPIRSTPYDIKFHFQIVPMVPDGAGYWRAGLPLTDGIVKKIDGVETTMFELQPRELSARVRPPLLAQPELEAPEASIFNEVGVDQAEFKKFLRQQQAAAIIVRNVTSRDSGDRQQPFNLRVGVPGGVESIATSGMVHEVKALEIFQAVAERGLLNGGALINGRRQIPTALTATLELNPGLSHEVSVEADGSVAAIVPAREALTWQLNNSEDSGIVKERYWLTFQPGEVRVCASCHGVSRHDQLERPAPTNSPAALKKLLLYYRDVLRTQNLVPKVEEPCGDPRVAAPTVIPSIPGTIAPPGSINPSNPSIPPSIENLSALVKQLEQLIRSVSKKKINSVQIKQRVKKITKVIDGMSLNTTDPKSVAALKKVKKLLVSTLGSQVTNQQKLKILKDTKRKLGQIIL